MTDPFYLPEEPTAAAAIAAIGEELDVFDDWMDRYQYIIELGRKLPPFPEAWTNDAHRVPGCQSKVWMEAAMQDGVLRLAGASDAAIVSGLVALLLRVYSGRAPEEIVATDPGVPARSRPDRGAVHQPRQRHRRHGPRHPRGRAVPVRLTRRMVRHAVLAVCVGIVRRVCDGAGRIVHHPGDDRGRRGDADAGQSLPSPATPGPARLVVIVHGSPPLASARPGMTLTSCGAEAVRWFTGPRLCRAGLPAPRLRRHRRHLCRIQRTVRPGGLRPLRVGDGPRHRCRRERGHPDARHPSRRRDRRGPIRRRLGRGRL